MRPVLLLCLLASCDLYFGPDPHVIVDPDGGNLCNGEPEPVGQGTCDCTDTIGWACNSCPFFETHDPVPCDKPGTGCDLENWEHGCVCVCNADGWWACEPETIGSTCPQPPPTDPVCH